MEDNWWCQQAKFKARKKKKQEKKCIKSCVSCAILIHKFNQVTSKLAQYQLQYQEIAKLNLSNS